MRVCDNSAALPRRLWYFALDIISDMVFKFKKNVMIFVSSRNLKITVYNGMQTVILMLNTLVITGVLRAHNRKCVCRVWRHGNVCVWLHKNKRNDTAPLTWIIIIRLLGHCTAHTFSVMRSQDACVITSFITACRPENRHLHKLTRIDHKSGARFTKVPKIFLSIS